MEQRAVSQKWMAWAGLAGRWAVFLLTLYLLIIPGMYLNPFQAVAERLEFLIASLSGQLVVIGVDNVLVANAAVDVVVLLGAAGVAWLLLARNRRPLLTLAIMVAAFATVCAGYLVRGGTEAYLSLPFSNAFSIVFGETRGPSIWTVIQYFSIIVLVWLGVFGLLGFRARLAKNSSETKARTSLTAAEQSRLAKLVLGVAFILGILAQTGTVRIVPMIWGSEEAMGLVPSGTLFGITLAALLVTLVMAGALVKWGAPRVALLACAAFASGGVFIVLVMLSWWELIGVHRNETMFAFNPFSAAWFVNQIHWIIMPVFAGLILFGLYTLLYGVSKGFGRLAQMGDQHAVSPAAKPE